MFASDAAKLFESLSSPSTTGEEADAFRHWVNHDVLPAIFATGGYILNPDCIATATVAHRPGMPFPSEAGDILAALAKYNSPACAHGDEAMPEDLAFEQLWRNDPMVRSDAEGPPVFTGEFFRLLREMDDQPGFRRINDHLDTVVLPGCSM